VVLLLERILVSWSLAMDDRSGHQDLCDSGRRSVTPYVHETMALYCSSLALPHVSLSLSSGRESVFNPREDVSTWSIYSSRSGSYNETQSLTG
jgi:hypothetical protein